MLSCWSLDRGQLGAMGRRSNYSIPACPSSIKGIPQGARTGCGCQRHTLAWGVRWPKASVIGKVSAPFDNQGSPQWVSGHSKSAASAKPWSLRAIAPHMAMKYGLLGSIAVRIRAISVLQMPPVGLSCMRALTRGSAHNVLPRTFGRVNMPVSTRGC